MICSYGPLFPRPQYLLAQTFLVPASCYFAVAIVSCMLVFPQSMNSMLVSQLDECLEAVQELVEANFGLLTLSSEDPAWRSGSQKTGRAKQRLVAGIIEVEQSLGMMELEISYGRTSPADVKAFTGLAKMLAGRAIALITFQASRPLPRRSVVEAPFPQWETH